LGSRYTNSNYNLSKGLKKSKHCPSFKGGAFFMKKKDLGKKGEEIAEKYLIKSGYKIIERNFRTKYGEIDLICEKDSSIIFIEVRTKSNLEFVSPEESISSKKIDHIKNSSLDYLSKNKKKYKDIKFEFIGILISSKNDYKLNHLKDIIF
jgi:putative endonuclease